MAADPTDDGSAEVPPADVLQTVSTIGVATLSPDGQVTVATDSFCHLTGLSIGDRLLDVIANGQRDAARAALRRADNDWIQLHFGVQNDPSPLSDRVFRFRRSSAGVDVIVEDAAVQDAYRSYQQLVDDLMELHRELVLENRELRRALSDLEATGGPSVTSPEVE